MRVRWTPASADDLQHIGEYLKEHNPAVAQSTVETLYEAAQSLTRFPYRGRIGQQEGTREWVVSRLPYVIVYEVDEEIVNISRVLHGSQDWPGQKRLR